MTQTATPYRTPGKMLGEPAPYLSQFLTCPFCDACPAFLYHHADACPWWKAYLAAGKKMRPSILDDHMNMTDGEWAAVRALVPPPPRPPSLWQRLRARFV
jgi:hypothetical protein